MTNASLVNMNVAGTPTATPATPKKTKPTKCKKTVVKPNGLGICRQKAGEEGRVDRHAVHSSCDVVWRVSLCCSVSSPRCVERYRRGFVRRIRDDSHCTHGFDVLVAWLLWRCLSTGSSAVNAQRQGVGAASSHLRCVSFALAPFGGWRCAEVSSCKSRFRATGHTKLAR